VRVEIKSFFFRLSIISIFFEAIGDFVAESAINRNHGVEDERFFFCSRIIILCRGLMMKYRRRVGKILEESARLGHWIIAFSCVIGIYVFNPKFGLNWNRG
jgi:hypothetical protein